MAESSRDAASPFHGLFCSAVDNQPQGYLGRRALLSVVAAVAIGLAVVSTMGCRSSGSLTRSVEPAPSPLASRSSQYAHEEARSVAGARDLADQTGPNAMAEERSPDTGRWSRWLSRLGKPKRIPLPRTDLRERPEVDVSSTQLSARSGEESVF